MFQLSIAAIAAGTFLRTYSLYFRLDSFRCEVDVTNQASRDGCLPFRRWGPLSGARRFEGAADPRAHIPGGLRGLALAGWLTRLERPRAGNAGPLVSKLGSCRSLSPGQDSAPQGAVPRKSPPVNAGRLIVLKIDLVLKRGEHSRRT